MTLTDFSLTADQREAKRRHDYIAGLRQMADFFEAHPDLPVPHGCSHNVFAHDRSELATVAREGGVKWRKNAVADYLALAVDFPGGTSYEVNVNRSHVCRKVVTGKRIEPATPAREVETYEWICDEPLLAGAK